MRDEAPPPAQPLGSGLIRHTAWNGVAQLLPSIVGVVLTPVFVHRLGLEAYGVWALTLAVLGVLTSVDGGVGASLVRFFGSHRATQNPRAAAQLFVVALAIATGIGTFSTAVTFAAADWAVEVVNIPPQLVSDAALALRLVGPLVGLALVANVPLALLQAHDRFRAISLITTAATAAYAGAAAMLLVRDPAVRSLLIAFGLRFVVVAVLGTVCARRHLAARRPFFPSRGPILELLRYSASLQVSALLGLVNSQVDALIIAAFLPVRYVGIYAVGFQAAWTARGIALWAMAPVASRLFVDFGLGGREAACRSFLGLNAAWQQTVTVFEVIVAAAIFFAVPVWVGSPILAAAWVAAGLSIGYSVNITTAVASSYVRAIGRPKIETLYAAVSVAVNVVLTIPFALMWGIYGVVAATAIGTVVGTATLPWFGRRSGVPELSRMISDLPVAKLGGAVVLTLAGELLLPYLITVTGFARLLVVAAPPIVAFCVVVGRRSSVLVSLAGFSDRGADAALPRRT